MGNKTATANDDIDESKPWLTFFVDNETYAVGALQTQEVLQQNQVTPVPGAPPHILGVINVRGDIVTVVDTRTVIGCPRAEATKQTRIVLIDVHNETLGLLVDSVVEIVSIKDSEVEPTASAVGGHDYVMGVYYHQEKLTILLSVDKLLSKDEVI